MPRKKSLNIIRAAFKSTLPVMLGYLPLGIAFGLLFGKLGYHWLWSTLIAMCVYAGGAQFLAISLILVHADLATIFLATLLMNLRHVFYGVAMLENFTPLGRAKWLVALGLTDETFSVLSSKTKQARDPRFVMVVTALNYFYWILGCTLGALIGKWLTLPLDGLEFALTALFGVLLIERIKADRNWIPIALAAVSALVVQSLSASHHFLVLSIAVSTVGLLAIERFRHA